MIITLKSKGVEVELLPIGAVIYQIKTKNKEGKFRNICLSHKNIEEYKNGNSQNFGNTIGRVAGRIKEGTLSIDGVKYNLTKNFRDKHCLHGGNKGFGNVLWDYEVFEDENTSKCVFTHSSEHLNEGFPGNVDIKVEYILKDNSLTINFYGVSDRKTFLNLTNHSYFNLSDTDEETVYEHLIQLNSSRYLTCDSDVITLDIKDVANTEYDLRTLKAFGDLHNKQDSSLREFKGFDNCFLLDREDRKLSFDLYLKEEKSGRSILVETSYPTIVMYTHNFPAPTELINRKNIEHIGVAIEPQYAPNAVNDERLFIPVVDVDKPYFETIKYTFNV